MNETYYRSETSFYREEALPYCGGVGLDIGFGGDPIKPSAITIDMDLVRYYCGPHPCNIRADARTLPWFATRSLDYVYSSHCLEDFLETRDVLREWFRVVKLYGHLVLLLPDQRKYERHCRAEGVPGNPAHRIADFGPEYLRPIVAKMSDALIVLLKENLGEYSFLCVIEKVGWSMRIRNRLKKVPGLYRLKKAILPGKPPA
ncbi:MAG: class I SAM-dependent methyltransferase [Candidatus Aminicenantales bacterium]